MLIRLLLTVGLLLIGTPTDSFLSICEARDHTLTLHGEVLAVNTEEVPKIMVMRVLTKGGAEMVVGALIYDETKIEKKGQVATLDEVVEGDKVTLIYEKTAEGAKAKTITIP